ncbi:MAG TPA: GNAT family protein [Polyangiaceae bacterium]|nr:GNAT family protein [Polyangiaceae bacterium]
MPPQAPTVRARLEPPAMRHAAAFVQAVQQSRAFHRPWAYPPSTIEQYRAFLRRARRRTHLSHLVYTEADELAGVININEIVRGNFGSGYLGYYALSPHQGRGYLRAGLSQVMQRAFGEYGLHRLEANIQPDNQRSIALVRSLGFRQEGYSPKYLKIGGRYRDHERWAILAEEWKATSRRSR